VEVEFSEVHIHDPEYPSLSGWGNAAKHLNNRACAPMLSAGRGSHGLRPFIVLCPVPMPAILYTRTIIPDDMRIPTPASLAYRAGPVQTYTTP
jgi:hypothetical protein